MISLSWKRHKGKLQRIFNERILSSDSFSIFFNFHSLFVLRRREEAVLHCCMGFVFLRADLRP